VAYVLRPGAYDYIAATRHFRGNHLIFAEPACSGSKDFNHTTLAGYRAVRPWAGADLAFPAVSRAEGTRDNFISGLMTLAGGGIARASAISETRKCVSDGRMETGLAGKSAISSV